MKVINELSSYSEEGLRRFELFIQSPYFIKNNDLRTFYQEFIIPTLKSEKKIQLFKLKFIEEYKWSDQKFRKTSHALNTTTKLFKASETLIQRNNLIDLLSLFHDNSANINPIESPSHKLVVDNSDYDFSSTHMMIRYLLIKEQIELSTDEKKGEYWTLLNHLIEIIKDYEKSLINIELKNLEFLGVTYQSDQNSELILANPVLKIHQEIELMYSGKNIEESLNIILSIIDQNPKINWKIKRDIIVKCANHLIITLNAGQTDLYPLIFKTYKTAIDGDFLILDKDLYRNIPYLACKSHEFEWALEFVEKYKDRLSEEDKESAYSFTKARTLWYAKDWEGVIRTLRNVEYKDMAYNLLARSYILTCYYELDDYEPLDSLIKSFKVYLRRKRNVSKARKDSFYNFITALDHLMKASERSDYKRILKAKEVIAKNPSTRNQDWLYEKIEELEAIIPQPKSKSKAKP